MDVIVKGQPSIEVRMEAKVVDSYKTADAALSESSVNPVQNKVITAELNKKATKTEVSSLSETLAAQLDTINEKVEENKTATDKAVSDLSAKVDEEVEGLQTQLDSDGVLIEDLQESKADVSGYYPQLSVGQADNLPDRGDVTEGFLGFRESAGASNSIEDGTANVKELLGESLVWNQIVDNSAATLFKEGNTNTILSVEGDIYTLTAKAAGTIYAFYRTQDFIKALVIGHKYLRLTEVQKSSNEPAHVQMYEIKGDSDTSISVNDTWSIVSSFFTITEITSATPFLRFIVHNVEVGDYMSFRKTTFVDLTKMFGAGNEPSTIEEFEAIKNQLVGVDFNAYNEGEVLGVNIKGIKSVNDNAWDEKWRNGIYASSTGEYAYRANCICNANAFRILPNEEYWVDVNTEAYFFCYDENMQFIKYLYAYQPSKILTPANAAYMNFYCSEAYGSTYNHDICIRLAHSGYKTDYVAHEEAESSFDLTKYFPNGMHGLNGVRDSATPKKATRRFGSVDMGTLGWALNASGAFGANVNGILPAGNNYVSGIIQSRYAFDTSGGVTEMVDKSIRRYGMNVYIKDSSYTDAASFKAAMSGVMLYYELATPIETEIDPQLNMNYKVWDFGTEELLTDSKSAPVLARIIYGFNATDTIRGNKATIENHERRITDLENEVVRVGDYQPDLSVGVADQLAGNGDATPSEIGFRRSGGGAILDGNARIEAIKGNSVVWNQLISLWKGSHSIAGVTIMVDKEVVANGTSEMDNAISVTSPNPYMIQGHKYFLRGCPSSGSPSTYYLTDQTAEHDYGNGVIFTANYESGSRTIIIRFNAGVTFNNVVFRPQLFDLTQMFGAGNEPTTIEEFYARKPIVEDEYAYNEGEVIHNAIDKIESVGVNQWDEEWEIGSFNVTTGEKESANNFIRSVNKIKVIPGASYYIPRVHSQMYAWLYDSDGNYIQYIGLNTSGRIFTFGSNVCYINFRIGSATEPVATYNHYICINLSDPSVNGKYFPYVKREQSLDIIGKYFPQGMKSAGTAHDEIRYNKVTQKWEKVQRIGEVDMGTMKWEQHTTEENIVAWYATVMSDMRKNPSSALKANMLCGRYINETWNDLYYGRVAEGVAQSSVYLRLVSPELTTKEDVLSALQGVMLYYELAEPIVTEIEENFNLDYEVWNAGTEKAIADTPSTPLKADIIYGFNAYGVIKELLARVASLEAANASLASQLASVTSHNEEV